MKVLSSLSIQLTPHSCSAAVELGLIFAVMNGCLELVLMVDIVGNMMLLSFVENYHLLHAS